MGTGQESHSTRRMHRLILVLAVCTYLFVVFAVHWLCCQFTYHVLVNLMNHACSLYILTWTITKDKTPVFKVIVRPWSVCPSSIHHFQRYPPKLLGQSKPNFIWNLSGIGERKFVRRVWVTWSGWPPHPYMIETLWTSSPEPKGQWPCGLVCSIRALGPS